MTMSAADEAFFKLAPFLSRIRHDLDGLPDRRTRAFATACAERAFTFDVKLNGPGLSILRPGLDLLWAALQRGSIEDSVLLSFRALSSFRGQVAT